MTGVLDDENSRFFAVCAASVDPNVDRSDMNVEAAAHPVLPRFPFGDTLGRFRLVVVAGTGVVAQLRVQQPRRRLIAHVDGAIRGGHAAGERGHDEQKGQEKERLFHFGPPERDFLSIF